MLFRLGSALSLIVLAPTVALAFSSGPPADRDKLCGTATAARACTSCHRAPRANSSAKIFELKLATDTPLPATYVPGQPYQLLLRFIEGTPTCAVTAPGGCGIPRTECGYGFEISSVREGAAASPGGCAGTPPSDDQAGCFTAAPSQQVKCGAGTGSASCSTACPSASATPVEFLMHGGCQILANTPLKDGREWFFGWTAPAAGAGRVRFDFAVNSTNGGDGNSMDNPYFKNAFIDEQTTTGTPPIPVADGLPPGIGPPGMKAVKRGTGFEVTWAATACPDDDYHLFYAPLRFKATFAYTGAACNLGTSGTARWSLPPPMPPAVDEPMYWLMAGTNAAGEESGHRPKDGGAGWESATGAGLCAAVTGRDTSRTCP